MSLLIGDDSPEGVEPQEWENQAPAERGRPAPGGKRHDWSRWRGHRPRSMLIQDAPDPAEDGAEDVDGAEDDDETGPPYRGNGFFLDPGPGPVAGPQDRYRQDLYYQDGYPGDRITGDRYPEIGYAGSRDYRAGAPGFPGRGYPEPGRSGSGYPGADDPGPGYSEPGHPGSRYSASGYRDSGHPDSGYADPGYAGHPVAGYQDPGYAGQGDRGAGYPDPGHAGQGNRDSGYADPGYAGQGDRGAGYPDSGYPDHPGGEGWYEADGDGFRLPPVPDGDPWDDGDYEADPEERPGRRAPLLEVLFPRRDSRDRDGGGSRMFASSAQRLGGVLLAGASVVGVALYVPSILAADSRSFTGVVSDSGIAGLNFGASGRVGSVLVHLGQAVRKGEVLATEAGAAGTAAVQADQAAITADKANLAALQADGAAATSVAAAHAELAKDRARRAVDRMKLAATEIVAPSSGTVVAIDGQPGETVSPAGLSGSAAHTQASPGRQRRFSLLPSGPTASLRATGMTLPVIALRTGGGWQVKLLIPQTDTSAVKAGGHVTISVPAAGLSGVKGAITELSPTPATSSGSAAYEAVVQVLGRTPVTPLTGMTANVQLGSLRLEGRASPAPAHPAPAPPTSAPPTSAPPTSAPPTSAPPTSAHQASAHRASTRRAVTRPSG